VDVAFVTFRFSWREDGVGLGVTTGNRLVKSPGGVTVVPGSPGAEVGSGPVPGAVGEDPAWLSTVETEASAWERVPPDGAWEPCITTVRPICSPAGAFLRMWSVTSISNAWYAGSEPTEQDFP
jgi:hypothetical protein